MKTLEEKVDAILEKIKKHEHEEVIKLPTMGTMHRCNICWSEVHPGDNGFIPINKKYPHSKTCPSRGKF